MKFKDIIVNAFRVKELRKKMFMTLMLILVFRIGCIIPVPGLTDNAFSQLSNNGMFRLYDMPFGRRVPAGVSVCNDNQPLY